jgi:hypothetical protein
MKVIRYILDWFETDRVGNSRAKFEAGKFYPPHADAATHIAMGAAEEVDAPEGVEKAIAAAEKAADRADSAVAAAAAAASSAAAAAAAAALAEPVVASKP